MTPEAPITPSSSQNQNKKNFLIAGISGVMVVALVALVIILITPPTSKKCDLRDNKAGSKTPAQIAAIIAPTDSFVDFETVITAAETSIEEDLGSKLPEDQIGEAKGRQLSIVVADGVPQLAVRKTVQAEGNSDYDIREAAIPRAFKAFNSVYKCSAGSNKTANDQIATEEESDLLGALAIAADQFSEPGAIHTIYILGNGYQTAGAIKMQEPGQFPMTSDEALQLSQSLEDIGALPDLQGARVVWYGLGQVDGDRQKPLGQRADDALILFWQDVISRSNGVLLDEDTHGKVGGGMPNSNSIKVTPVEGHPCTVVRKLYEKDGVKFKPNSAVFVDPAKAKKSAKDVADAFEAASCNSITVHGYAASGVAKEEYNAKSEEIDATNIELTLRRAKAFANLLKSVGFDGEINTDGAGTCTDEQWTSSGKLDESLQQLCRRVEVTN